MSSNENGVIAGMEQAEADANLQYGISLLHPYLVKLILSNSITKRKLGDKKTDFSQSLQAIIEDWNILYPPGSKFAAFQTYFLRAKKVRHWVAHQSFDRNRYQHCMECLANVATAIGKPDLAKIIINLVVVEEDEAEKQEESISKEEKNQINITSLKKDEWTSVKEQGNQLYKEELWEEAMNCYTRAIHLNQGEAVLYSNRALCELRLSKFDLAREDIEDAIQLDPKNIKYFRVLSEVLLEMKLHKESLAACLQGLEINPRDEVLILRERDCFALIAADFTWNPPVDESVSKIPFEQIGMKMLSRFKNLNLPSEDIEDCPNPDKLTKLLKISESIIEAHQLKNLKISSSSKKSPERKAFEIFEAAAKKGNADGLYNMALFYSEGKAGLPRDFYKAVELCRKAAGQKAFIRLKETIIPNAGVAEAECFLGNCYREGRGVDPCSTKAFEWYLKSAQHECLSAQNNVGLALLHGYGCKKNETSARSWFQKAAEQGFAGAQYHYGMMLEEGLGGPIDPKKAGEQLKLSADQGFPGALKRLQNLSMSGAIGGSNMQITKENLQKAAGEGDPLSLFLLGQNYLSGCGGFEKDLSKAERNLREASKAGYSDANLPLGKLLLELMKNEEAIKFFKLAAEKGSAEGQFELGMLFAYGHGCARDEPKARRWLNRAAQQGLSLQHNGEEQPSDDWMEKEINIGRETIEFENQKQLTSEGMSIPERKARFITSKLDSNHPATSAYLEYLEIFPPGGRPPPTPIIRSMKGMTPMCLKELDIRAQNGSTTAKSFFYACEMVERAMDLLKQNQTNDVFKLVRLSLREWDLPIPEYSPFYWKCIDAAKKALDRNSQDADALYALARLDMSKSNAERLQMAKRCVELDPTIPDYYHLFSCMLGFAGSYQNGLRAVDRAIELLPNHPDWLFGRAEFIRLIDEGVKKVKNIYNAAEVYSKFLSLNPTDHRQRPEAFYCLAEIYAFSGDKTKAEMYYQKGLDAEDPKVRLPCFEPVRDFLPKKTTKMLLNAWEGRNS